MFTVHARQVADTNPFVFLDGVDGLTAGVACKIVAGKLAKCGASDKPSHICRGVRMEDGAFPAEPVNALTEYKAPVTGTPAIGAVVTLGADAESVTATATNGVFTVTGVFDGYVTGYFQ